MEADINQVADSINAKKTEKEKPKKKTEQENQLE